jgi:hypothetical protein
VILSYWIFITSYRAISFFFISFRISLEIFGFYIIITDCLYERLENIFSCLRLSYFISLPSLSKFVLAKASSRNSSLLTEGSPGAPSIWLHMTSVLTAMSYLKAVTHPCLRLSFWTYSKCSFKLIKTIVISVVIRHLIRLIVLTLLRIRHVYNVY